jgi:hypothetical protein
MTRLRLLAVGTVLMFAMNTVAQQNATSPDARAAAVAPVDQHLKMLSEKLALTAEQQDKARPILQAMHDGSQKLADDPSLTPDQRQAGMHELFMKSDRDVRVFLTDDQKKKLDDLEAEMHHGTHGGSNGSPSATPQN